MLLRLLFKNRDKRKRIAHIGAAVVILIHSYEKYEGGHDIYKIFAVAGLIFLSLAIFHPIIEKKAPGLTEYFF